MDQSQYAIDHVVEALMLARMYAVKQLRPYYATAIFRMVPIATRLVPTLGVDKWWRLYYNPDLVATLDVKELASVLIHEVEHLLRDHAGRCERHGWDHERFNFAGDCEINDDLVKDKAAMLPEWVVTPAKYNLKDGLLAEEYYRLLPPHIGSDGQGAECGSGAHGKEQEHELGPPNSKQRGVGKKEGELVRKKVAEDTLDHHNKNPGTVPGEVVRWAESVVKPQIPWERQFAGAVRAKWARATGMSDYSYQRPSRRQSVVPDIILPSLVEPTPNVVICIDTSGSMDPDQLALALSESKGVIRAVGGEDSIHVISVDCMVNSVQKVFSPRQITLRGGGGTDMGEGIAAATLLRPKPDFIIVMTDGFTGWPADAPKGSDVIVLLIPNKAGIMGVGPSGWGRTIALPGKKQPKRRLVA